MSIIDNPSSKYGPATDMLSEQYTRTSREIAALERQVQGYRDDMGYLQGKQKKLQEWRTSYRAALGALGVVIFDVSE